VWCARPVSHTINPKTTLGARELLDPADAALLDLPLLVALGWYLMFLAAQDVSMVAVTVATTG